MMDILSKIDTKKTGIFAAGVLFGTAGIKILSSRDAKKVYTHCTAAVLRAKEGVMKVVTCMQENAEDIYAEATQINAERASKETEFEDESDAQDRSAAEEASDAQDRSNVDEASDAQDHGYKEVDGTE
ncbi:MAG: hypothetical protein K2N87_11525 [Eubacterium sp.]|nr:hypothetical protein [Eubacterium sp.]